MSTARSLSARRAWIEIVQRSACWRCLPVALRKESVDRNRYPLIFRLARIVALRKESVDRNSKGMMVTVDGRLSLSARRAWIEIALAQLDEPDNSLSLSARRAWIEMANLAASWALPAVALRKESVDRNRSAREAGRAVFWSLSARRAWIEIRPRCWKLREKSVALRKESVDRNPAEVLEIEGEVTVALRKESVDRNSKHVNISYAEAVALRKESVDRNSQSTICCAYPIMSLSARRAWIEISGLPVAYRSWPSLSARRAWIEISDGNKTSFSTSVALRKESVDRNYGSDLSYSDGVVSLSARRAWIEMFSVLVQNSCTHVALRKESVDRNALLNTQQRHLASLSARRAWIEIIRLN